MFTYMHMHFWRLEENLWELVLFIHHVGIGDRTHVARLGSRCLYSEPSRFYSISEATVIIATYQRCDVNNGLLSCVASKII